MPDQTGSRVKEDDGLSLTQFVKNTTKVLIARVDAMRIGQNLKPRCAKMVKRIVYFCKGAFHVWEGEGREEEEMVWVIGAGFGHVDVGLAGYGSTFFVVARG